MATEIEIKLVTPANALGQSIDNLCRLYDISSLHVNHLTTSYYDTKSFLLKQKKIALRVREGNGKPVQTLKTAGIKESGLFVRGEWEWDLDSTTPDISLLTSNDAWPEDLSGKELNCLFKTEVQRRSALIYWQGAEIEWVIDEGKVVGTHGSENICEMELELKKGHISELFDVAEQMVVEVPSVLSNISKAHRGYRLFSKEPSQAAITYSADTYFTNTKVPSCWQEAMSRAMNDWLKQVDIVNYSGQFDDYLNCLCCLAEMRSLFALSPNCNSLAFQELQHINETLFTMSVLDSTLFYHSQKKGAFLSQNLSATQEMGKLSIKLTRFLSDLSPDKKNNKG